MRHEQGELVGALADQLERGAQEFAANTWRRGGPSVGGLRRGVERAHAVVRAGSGDGADDAARGGVDDVERLACRGIDPLATDEQLVRDLREEFCFGRS